MCVKGWKQGWEQKGMGGRKEQRAGGGGKGVVVAVAGDLELGAVGLLLSEQ